MQTNSVLANPKTLLAQVCSTAREALVALERAASTDASVVASAASEIGREFCDLAARLPKSGRKIDSQTLLDAQQIGMTSWLVIPESIQSIEAAIQRSRTFTGTPTLPDVPLMQVSDGIATIAIEGVLMRKPSVLARVLMGATDMEEIAAAFGEAMSRSDVRAVLLDIDSPGGTVAGTPELAHAVESLNKIKPVYAFSGGLMCSGAYWIASQAGAIYATPSARVGSIGVAQVMIDRTGALQQQGIRLEVFSVGKYKAMGAPGTTLTDEHRQHIQENLQEISADFRTAVRSRGRRIPDSAMEGQTFSGKKAEKVALCTMVNDRAEVVAMLRKASRPASPTVPKASPLNPRSSAEIIKDIAAATGKTTRSAQATAISRAEMRSMSPAAVMTHFRSGGKLTD